VTAGSRPPADSRASTDAARPSRWLRFLDGLAGLLAAGMVILGVLLLASGLIAPPVLSAAGLGPAAGPGWLRVGAHLLVGAAGELVVRNRRNWSPAVRATADLSVVLAAVVVIGWAWWL